MNHLAKLRKPICIFSSARTGSHLLQRTLQETLKYNDFGELFNPNKFTRDHTSRYKTSDKFIWLQKPNHVSLEHFNEISSLMNRSYIIKLKRHDVVSQIASYYMQCYFGWQTPKTAEYSVLIDQNLIKVCINDILSTNNMVDQLEQYHEEMYYEDIVPIHPVRPSKSHYPVNYNQLKQAVVQCWETFNITALNQSIHNVIATTKEGKL